MPLNLQNQIIQIVCPSCGAKITLKFKEVGSTKVCPKCKNKVHFKDNNFKRDMKKLENEIKNFERQLKHFGK